MKVKGGARGYSFLKGVIELSRVYFVTAEPCTNITLPEDRESCIVKRINHEKEKAHEKTRP